jgi:hypothetical protein
MAAGVVLTVASKGILGKMFSNNGSYTILLQKCDAEFRSIVMKFLVNMEGYHNHFAHILLYGAQ